MLGLTFTSQQTLHELAWHQHTRLVCFGKLVHTVPHQNNTPTAGNQAFQVLILDIESSTRLDIISGLIILSDTRQCCPFHQPNKNPLPAKVSLESVFQFHFPIMCREVHSFWIKGFFSRIYGGNFPQQ